MKKTKTTTTKTIVNGHTIYNTTTTTTTTRKKTFVTNEELTVIKNNDKERLNSYNVVVALPQTNNESIEPFTDETLYFIVAKWFIANECLFNAAYAREENAHKLYLDTAKDCYRLDKEVDASNNAIAQDLRYDIFEILKANNVKYWSDIFGDDCIEVTHTVETKKLSRLTDTKTEKEITEKIHRVMSKHITKYFRNYGTCYSLDAYTTNTNTDSNESLFDCINFEFLQNDIYAIDTTLKALYSKRQKAIKEKDRETEYKITDRIDKIIVARDFVIDGEIVEYIDTLATKCNLTINEKIAIIGYAKKLSLHAIGNEIIRVNNLKSKAYNNKAVKKAIASAFEKIQCVTFEYLKTAK